MAYVEERIVGMFLGHFLGDALGAPHEFACNRNVKYTGKLEHQPFMNTAYQGQKRLAVGQVTDDTEMTLALLRCLIKEGGYTTGKVIEAYSEWANSGGWMMGKNTRKLFKGVGIRGYHSRYAKMLATGAISQSNGSLMRACPLALLKDNLPALEDARLTNPSQINLDANLVYIHVLRQLLWGISLDIVIASVDAAIQTNEVKEVWKQAQARTPRDLGENKGWVLHALYCAFVALCHYESYTELLAWVIPQVGSDSDTNAAIAGAIMGAKLGSNQLVKEQANNISVLLGVNVNEGPTPRQAKYTLTDFNELMQATLKLASS